MTDWNSQPLDAAIEQWIWFRGAGMTDHEIMSACGRQFSYGMTGDEIIAEMVYAWQGLERTSG